MYRAQFRIQFHPLLNSLDTSEASHTRAEFELYLIFSGTIGQNVTIHQKIVIITLIVGHAPTFGFKLEYYSSGSNWNTDLTGYAVLATTKGNLTYPINGGNYRSFENALFPIAPTVPGQPTLRFTRVDLEVHSSCLYDSIKTYNWFNGEYRQVSM